MIRFVKLAAIIGVLAIGLAFVAQSRAAIFVTPDNPFNTTLEPSTGWPSYSTGPTYTGGVQQQDKIWKWVSNTLPVVVGSSDLPLVIRTQVYSSYDLHTLNIGALPGGPETYTLQYTISVDTSNPADANLWITAAGLSIDPGFGNPGIYTITKQLTSSSGLNDTLQITQANPNPVTVTFAPQKSVTVLDTWTYNSLGNIQSTTNQFVETTVTPPAVPEPSTLIVWSVLGGLGLGVGWWRKRTA